MQKQCIVVPTPGLNKSSTVEQSLGNVANLVSQLMSVDFVLFFLLISKEIYDEKFFSGISVDMLLH